MNRGFMGRSHALLSIMLLCICLLIPVNVFKETIWLLKENILFFVIGIVITVGGALLPDLDNNESSAGSTLGFMGQAVSNFMQTTSYMIWNLVHAKREKRPPVQHRYFWHTAFAGIGILCMFAFGLPKGDTKIIADIKEKSFLTFLQDNVILLFFILFLFMAVLCGSNMVMYYLITKLRIPKALNYISPVAMCGYLFVIDYDHLRILGICLSLGYIFHCIEDCFADSGVPILFPIPIKGHFWYRIKFFITCPTGRLSLPNTIIDIVALVIDLGLIALILLQRRVI